MKRLNLDSLPPVTEDEALELMVHHLQMAAIYYMNVSDDAAAVLQEAERLVTRDDARGADCPQWVAARAFIDASWRAHEIIRRKGLDGRIVSGRGNFGWIVNTDDGDIEACVDLFPSRKAASDDYDDWCNMRGKYAQ